MASGESQEPGLLHERLREQVSLSIRESLEKATSVLSNLHRVQSYFDVIRNMSPSRGTGGGAHTTEGIKNALEQIRTIRADAATLLQTVYLTEIGLQSLQVCALFPPPPPPPPRASIHKRKCLYGVKIGTHGRIHYM